MGNLGDGSHVASKTPAISHPLPAELQIAVSLRAEACRCFSLITGIINSCQSRGLGWEGDATPLARTVVQEVLSV